MKQSSVPQKIEKGTPVWMWATHDVDQPQWISGIVVSVWPSEKGAVVRWDSDSSQDDYPFEQLQFTSPIPVSQPAAPSPAKVGNHCHYCGAPAYRLGFFDEPVCSQCS